MNQEINRRVVVLAHSFRCVARYCSRIADGQVAELLSVGLDFSRQPKQSVAKEWADRCCRRANRRWLVHLLSLLIGGCTAVFDLDCFQSEI